MSSKSYESEPKMDACLPDRRHDPIRYQARTHDLNLLWRGIMVKRRGDAAQRSRLAGGALRRHQAEERHELARMIKAAQVPRFGDDRHRRHQLHPAHRLE